MSELSRPSLSPNESQVKFLYYIWFDGIHVLINMRTVSCLFLSLISLYFATIIGCSQNPTAKSFPSVIPVTVIKAKNLSEFSFPIKFFGRIQSARRISLAFEIPGQVTTLHVDEGEVVKAGDTIARLDTSILVAERNKLLASKSVEETILRRLEKGERDEVITAARAMVRKIDAELEHATRESERTKRLRDQNAVSESEFEMAYFNAKSLKASLDAAKARLSKLEAGTREEDIEVQKNRILELDAQVAVVNARIEKAVLTAPFKAHVVRRMVDEGAVVKEGQTVLMLSEADRYEARFSVPITQIEEAEATKTIFIKGKNVPVQKARTISSVSPKTRTIDVVFTLEPSLKVIEGQTCSLELTEKVNRTCVKLPVSALVPSIRGLWSVYRLEKKNESQHFRVIRVEATIHHTDGDHVFVETTLPDYSLIVRDGVHKLVPGMVVRVKEGEP